MRQPSLQARRPSATTVPSDVGIASRLFPAAYVTSYVAPSVTAVAAASSTAAPGSSVRGSLAGNAATQKPKAVTATKSARRQSTTAFSRLYAHAIDLMEHKDDVFRHFGPCKERRRPQSAAPPVSSRRAAPSQAGARPSVVAPHPSSAFSSRRCSSPATPRKAARVGGRGRIYERSCSLSTSLRAPPAVLARTFSLQSTVASRAAVSPRPRPRREPSDRSAPKARGSTAPGRSPRPSVRAGPSSPRPVGRRRQASTAASVTSGPGGSLQCPKRRPSERPDGPAAAAAHPPSQRLGRRQSSFSILGVDALAPQRKVSVAGIARAATGRPSLAPPPVMVEVSRRTSSPMLVAVPGAAPSLSRRPSVARIPAAGSGSEPFRAEDAPPPAGSRASMAGPRASMVARRDAKLERLMEQVSVLKASLGLSEEDLQWKVESARGNAFLAAERRLGECEERLDRLAYEAQQLALTPCDEVGAALVQQLRALVQQAGAIAEAKRALVARQREVAERKAELTDARVQAEVRLAVEGGAGAAEGEAGAVDWRQSRLEAAAAELVAAQEQLRGLVGALNERLAGLAAETDCLGRACAAFAFLSPEAAAVSRGLVRLLEGLPECAGSGERLAALGEQAIQVTLRLRGSRAKDLRDKQEELERTARDAEVWKARREQAAEFAAEMAAREQQWRTQHAAENAASLRLMRALVPSDVRELSVEAMVERAARGGVLLPFELAAYVKHNRLLHWLVTHERDVARDNFLAAESAPAFVNLSAYDVVELRAVAAVLPAAFELDADGKKAAWRVQFLEHVQALVQRQHGERVKAGWDPERRARAEVPLPPLTDRQALNPVYRYATDAELQVRVERLERQQARLAERRERLRQLEDEQLPAAKAEYLALAEDARSEDLQRSFGRAAINQLRDAAKQQLASLGKARDALRAEVRHAEAAWAALSPSLEQLEAEAALVRRLDPEVRAARVPGPFPADVEPQPRARAAFKKLSVEEEARARREELDSAIARRAQDIGDSDKAAADAAAAVAASDAAAAASAATSASEAEAAAAKAAPFVTEAPAEEAETPARPFRQVRALRVAANVLRFLEQDFCSPKRVQAAVSASPGSAASTPVRRPTPTHQGDVCGGGQSAPAPAASAIPRPKSKALQLLLEKEEAAASSASREPVAEAAAPFAGVAGGRPNFLEELQRRAKRPDAGEGGPVAVTSRPAAQPPVSFLDELKRKALAKAAAE